MVRISVPLRRMVHMLLLRPQPSEWFNQFYRNLREFGIIPTDTRAWWKAGLSLAAVTAVGIIVAKVLHSSDKVR